LDEWTRVVDLKQEISVLEQPSETKNKTKQSCLFWSASDTALADKDCTVHDLVDYEELPAVALVRFQKVREIMRKIVDLMQHPEQDRNGTTGSIAVGRPVQANKAGSRKSVEESRGDCPGFVFHCNNTTEKICLTNAVLGLPSNMWEIIQVSITDTTIIFLYNFESHVLHGTWRASDLPQFAACPQLDSFPAQVGVGLTESLRLFGQYLLPMAM
jgi:hypothetical protein